MKTYEPLKLGFIGGGINSAVGNTHRIASQMDNRFVLEAGCFSKNHDINIETARTYGVSTSRVYKQWHDFLVSEKDNLDSVCILTPTNAHSKVIISAIELGYSVICEKSMTGTLKEAEVICETVEKNKNFLAVTYNYTGYPMIRELRQIIKKGRLGNINQIQIEMPQEGFARYDKKGQLPRPQNWRLEDGLIPTISLDLGVHLHHMIFFLTGEKPLEVVADQATYGFFKQVVDNVNCIAKYSGNMRAQIWYSKSALGHRNGLRIRIFGDKGSAEWFQVQPEELLVCDDNGKREIIDRGSNVVVADELRYNRFKTGHPAGFIEAFANHYYDIADSLIEFKDKGYHESPYVFNDSISIEGLRMLEAMAVSSSSGSWQKVNEEK